MCCGLPGSFATVFFLMQLLERKLYRVAPFRGERIYSTAVLPKGGAGLPFKYRTSYAISMTTRSGGRVGSRGPRRGQSPANLGAKAVLALPVPGPTREAPATACAPIAPLRRLGSCERINSGMLPKLASLAACRHVVLKYRSSESSPPTYSGRHVSASYWPTRYWNSLAGCYDSVPSADPTGTRLAAAPTGVCAESHACPLHRTAASRAARQLVAASSNRSVPHRQLRAETPECTPAPTFTARVFEK